MNVESLLQRAYANCDLSAIPENLTIRTKEFKTLQDFVDKNLKMYTSGAIFITGNPSVGKTTVVQRVVERLYHKRFNAKSAIGSVSSVEKEEQMHNITTLMEEEKKKLNYSVIYVNAATLITPATIFNHLLNHYVSDQPDVTADVIYKYSKITSSRAKDTLMRLFTTSDTRSISSESITASKLKRPLPLIAFIDEFDYLDTKNHEIVYALFELASSGLCFTLIGIANRLSMLKDMDKLRSRVASPSSDGIIQIPFCDYTKSDMREILVERLNAAGKDVVEAYTKSPAALELLLNRVEKMNLDVRQLLVLAPRALTAAFSDGRSFVTPRDVVKVLSTNDQTLSVSNAEISCISNLSVLEIAILIIIKITNMPTVEDIYSTLLEHRFAFSNYEIAEKSGRLEGKSVANFDIAIDSFFSLYDKYNLQNKEENMGIHIKNLDDKLESKDIKINIATNSEKEDRAEEEEEEEEKDNSKRKKVLVKNMQIPISEPFIDIKREKASDIEIKLQNYFQIPEDKSDDFVKNNCDLLVLSLYDTIKAVNRLEKMNLIIADAKNITPITTAKTSVSIQTLLFVAKTKSDKLNDLLKSLDIKVI